MKVAVVQIEWADSPEEGRANARRAVAEATRGGEVDLLCFPEFFLGPPWYMPGQDHLRGTTDTPIPSPLTDEFCDLAREHGCNIVLGSVVEALDDGKYRNTCLFIDRSGTILGSAVKAHAFGNEMVVCRQAEGLGIIETDLGPIGIAVCSDFWVPEVIRLMAAAGAHTVFVPGGTLRQNQELMVNALTTTAYLNNVNIVYASSVGVVEGRRGDRLVQIHFSGTSLVTTPQGVLAQAANDRPETLYVDLPEPAADGDGRRWLDLRRPEAYQALLEPYADMHRDLAEELRSTLAPTSAAPAVGSGARA